MKYKTDLVNVVVVNQSASLTSSGGRILKFESEVLDDKSFTWGKCNSSCSKSPDATFSALLLVDTHASYLYKRHWTILRTSVRKKIHYLGRGKI